MDTDALNDADLSLVPPADDSGVWLPVPPSADLQGFSVLEFTAFYKTLQKWSTLALVRFHLDHINTSGTPDYFPTQVVRRGVLLDIVSRAAGLDRRLVEVILDRLTYRVDDPKADLFLTPYIAEGDEIAWSVRVVTSSQYLRNMLKLMARRSSLKATVDTLLGTMEKPLLLTFD